MSPAYREGVLTSYHDLLSPVSYACELNGVDICGRKIPVSKTRFDRRNIEYEMTALSIEGIYERGITVFRVCESY